MTLICSNVIASDHSCAFVGDSIAQGAHTFAPKCYSAAYNGITSTGWTKKIKETIAANKIIVSIGTNDWDTNKAEQSIRQLRTKLLSQKILWIAPGENFFARDIVLRVAQEFGDKVYERPTESLAKDGIHFHPSGYKKIASLIKLG